MNSIPFPLSLTLMQEKKTVSVTLLIVIVKKVMYLKHCISTIKLCSNRIVRYKLIQNASKQVNFMTKITGYFFFFFWVQDRETSINLATLTSKITNSTSKHPRNQTS